MYLNKNTGSIISQETAEELVASYQEKNPDEIISSFIGSNNIKALLNQEDCIGIRIYNGYDNTENKISLVVVGVDSNEKDMLKDAIIYDRMATCPPLCPVEGLLVK